MTRLLDRLSHRVGASLRGRAMLIVVVVAVAAAIGVAVVSAPTAVASPKTPPGALRTGAADEPTPLRPELDVEAFVQHAERLAESRRQRAQRILDQAYPGRAFVSVSVELDPRWERTTERVQPDLPAVVEDVRGGTERRRLLQPFAGTRESGLLAPEIARVTAAVLLDAALAEDRRIRDDVIATVANAVQARTIDVEVLARPPAAPVARAPAESPALEVGLAVPAVAIALVALSLAWWLIRQLLARRASAPPPQAEPAPAASAPDADALRDEIERAIGADSRLVSRLVEGWLSEGRA